MRCKRKRSKEGWLILVVRVQIFGWFEGNALYICILRFGGRGLCFEGILLGLVPLLNQQDMGVSPIGDPLVGV